MQEGIIEPLKGGLKRLFGEKIPKMMRNNLLLLT